MSTEECKESRMLFLFSTNKYKLEIIYTYIYIYNIYNIIYIIYVIYIQSYIYINIYIYIYKMYMGMNQDEWFQIFNCK